MKTPQLSYVLFFLFCTTFLYAQDVIILTNGDKLVGSIEKMERSILTFSTSYDDSDFKIKWGEVVSITSEKQFIVSITDGDRFTTSLAAVEGKEKYVKFSDEGHQQEFELDDIVFIEPIGKNFLARLTVDLDIGLTLTKANNLRQLNTNLNATYLATKWRANGLFKTVISTQDEAADIRRMDAELGGEYYLPHDWFVQATATFLSNNELLLDLRSTFKGGGGYYFIRDNSMFFSGLAGLAYTTEQYMNNDPTRNSTEGYVGLGFNKYDIGDLSITTGAYWYPGITESGRHRLDFNFDMKYDLPLDFYIRLGLQYNYDNRPAEGASEDDYVFTTSFGWEWN